MKIYISGLKRIDECIYRYIVFTTTCVLFLCPIILKYNKIILKLINILSVLKMYTNFLGGLLLQIISFSWYFVEIKITNRFLFSNFLRSFMYVLGTFTKY